MNSIAWFWVGLGGAIGSVGRFWISGLMARHYGETFPWGTLAVNVTGSLVIGLFATLTGPDGRWMVPGWFRTDFFMLGICGGFTTFSSFSLQTLNLLQTGQFLHALTNTLLSVCLCLGAVWLGHILAAAINR